MKNGEIEVLLTARKTRQRRKGIIDNLLSYHSIYHFSPYKNLKNSISGDKKMYLRCHISKNLGTKYRIFQIFREESF